MSKLAYDQTTIDALARAVHVALLEAEADGLVSSIRTMSVVDAHSYDTPRTLDIRLEIDNPQQPPFLFEVGAREGAETEVRERVDAALRKAIEGLV